MLNIRTLFQNYTSSAALNAYIPLWGFVDDQVFLTKTGDLGVVLEVQGIDYECLDTDELDAYTKRFENALRLLDPRFRLVQYLFRRDHPEITHRRDDDPVVDLAIRERVAHLEAKGDQLFRLHTYFVLLFQGFRHQSGMTQVLRAIGHPREALQLLRAQFSSNAAITFVEREIEQGVAILHQKLFTLTIQLADFLRVRLLDKGDAFHFLRRLVNFDPQKTELAELKHDTHLDYYLGDTHLSFHSDHLRADGYYVRVLSLREPTSFSQPLLLRALYGVPANFHLVTSWAPIPADMARKIIVTARRHHHTAKTSLISHVSDSTNPAEMLVDDSKSALVADLSRVLVELDQGASLGKYGFTAVVYDRDRAVVDRAVQQIAKAFVAADGSLYEETYNLPNAFFATLPGNQDMDYREVLVTDTNHADFSFLFALNTGDKENPQLDDEYLAVLETQHGTPYYLSLHVGDVAHTLVLGQTGAGKSFLLNFLATHAQKYKPHTFLFELGGSFRGVTKLFGGNYLALGGEGNEDVHINPFALEPTSRNLAFLLSFVRVLIEGHDAPVSQLDEKQLHLSLKNLYELPAGLRTLTNFANLIPPHLAERMHKWLRGDPPGPYAAYFDNAEDTVQMTRVLGVDFEGLKHYPDLVEALVFYLLHRASSVIYDPAQARTFKLFFLDEFWGLVSHPAIRNYVLEALKTWRKKNAAMVISTQSLADLVSSGLLEILAESCPTKIFLANKGADDAVYQHTFKLSRTAVELVKTLAPKRQLLLSRPDVTKVLTLTVDAKSYWLYTNDARDNARRDDAIAKHGFERALEILAQGASA